MIGVLSRGISRIESLAEFLSEPVVLIRPWHSPACDKVAGWGLRPTAAKARRYAVKMGIPYISLEDGFLRSVGLGSQDPPLSIVMDDVGIYYDATAQSRLEALIKLERRDAEIGRARLLAQGWREARVSKYNHAREFKGELPMRFVLVADQTFNDASVRFGLASEASFGWMLEAALDEHPGSMVLLKVHPDVFAGKKRGYFDLLTPGQASRVVVLGEDANPVRLLENAEAVYVVTSQIGFEALLWGKPVHTFGMPFYAGWGLTNDALPAPQRRKHASLENLIHASLVDYPYYIDPETTRRCEVERLLEWMALQRRMRERFPARVHALGFSRWKKPIVRAFFQGSEVEFVRSPDKIPAGATLAIWGSRQTHKPCVKQPAQILSLEDGFLRSVGLGADLVRPLSWVMDGSGIYYDSTSTSDLEKMLQSATFSDAILRRAKSLRERIVAGRLTKYNTGIETWKRRDAGQRVILVAGQVESDMSIRLGTVDIQTNMKLLHAVREANPDAYVIYKPHPDVVAGVRRKGAGENNARLLCDEILTDVSLGDLLDSMDEVHVLTSLAGFEALLRGKKVVAYGQPFYAGWGLTHDMAPISRRTRKLCLDELVAGVLIEYPTYISRSTGRFAAPERVLDELLQWRSQGVSGLPVLRKILRLVLRISINK